MNDYIPTRATNLWTQPGRASLSFRVAILAATWLAFAGQLPATELTRSQESLATLSTSVSTDKVQVAEPFTLELVVTAPNGARITLPAIGKQLGDFDVIDHQDVDDIPSRENATDRIWTRSMVLESITTGDLEVPPLEVRVHSGANSDTISSDAIPIKVISVLEGQADPTQIRDIHSVVDISVPQPNSDSWFWWLAGGGSLLALAAASVFVVAKRKSWLTPSQWAIHELDQLTHSTAANLGDSEVVSQRLSSVLRDYLELQLEISAPVQTTQELLRVVESRNLLDAETINRFAEIFESADLAKFAGVQLSPAELNLAIDEARSLVAEVADDKMMAEASAGSPSELKGTR